MALGKFINNIFGGGEVSPQVAQPGIAGFSGGGLTGSFNKQGRGGTFSVNSSGQRQSIVSNISNLFGQQSQEFGALRQQVQPGVGRLTTSRLAELEGRRASSVSNLRDNLARRRILGSSFAADAVTRREAEFAQEADTIRAESFLQELDLTVSLIDKEYSTALNSFNTLLSEMNLQADVAAKLSQGVQDALTTGAKLATEVALANQQAAIGAAEGLGNFIGNFIPMPSGG